MTSQNDHSGFGRHGQILKAGRKQRTSDDVPSFLSHYVPELPSEGFSAGSAGRQASTWDILRLHTSRAAAWLEAAVRTLRLQDIINIPVGIVLLWILVLWWGEEHVFNRSISTCEWDKWETWVCGMPLDEF